MAAALQHAAGGRPVFPLHGLRPGGGCTCPAGRECNSAGKHPRETGWQEKATTDPAAIRAWWGRWPTANIGIPTGRRSGWWVLDVDPRHGGDLTLSAFEREHGELPRTVEAVTGSGGRHILFALPEGFEIHNLQPAADRPSPLGEGLDLRGEGGLIAAPGSMHPSGGRYEWEAEHHPDDVPLAQAPEWLLALVRAANVRPAGAAPAIGERIPHGRQHDTLVSLAGSMRARGMNEKEIAAALLVTNAERCERPGPEENIRKIAASVMRYTPKQALARIMEPVRTDEEAPPERNGANGKAEAAAEEEPAVPEDEDGEAERSLMLRLASEWSAATRAELAWFEGGQWWRYREGYWAHTTPEVPEASVQAFLTKRKRKVKLTAAVVREVVFLGRSMLGPLPLSTLNAHPTWIPLENGVYDTETAAIGPHSPDHFLTHRLSFSFSREAGAPRWRTFLEETVIDGAGNPCAEWIDALQEWYGYCLVPDNSAQVSMVWVGEGRNGKGVAARALEALLGPSQTTAVSIDQMHEPYHRAQLQGKLVGFVNEPDRRSMIKNGAYFKAITGGDLIEARRPTENVFSFTPHCRLVISTNTLMETQDPSFGYFRRLLLIEWRRQIEEDRVDAELDFKIRAELPGIFNWAAAGLERFRVRGSRFPPLNESDRLLSEYRLDEDPAQQFIIDEFERGPAFTVTLGDFYDGFRRWCRAQGFPDPGSSVKVGRALGRKGFRPLRPRGDDGTRPRGWRGLGYRQGSIYAPRPDEQQPLPGPTDREPFR